MAHAAAQAPRRVVVAITGATGGVHGVRLLQALRDSADVEVHLVVSDAGALSLNQELGLKRAELEGLAQHVHAVRDIGAPLASGSFQSHAMIVAPCSMKTLAGIAHAFSDNLITRAADVMLKERRRLVLLTREAPLNLAHLRNMVAVTEMGGIIFPPVPSFYHHPRTLDEALDHITARLLDLIGIEHQLAPRWAGYPGEAAGSRPEAEAIAPRNALK